MACCLGIWLFHKPGDQVVRCFSIWGVVLRRIAFDASRRNALCQIHDLVIYLLPASPPLTAAPIEHSGRNSIRQVKREVQWCVFRCLKSYTAKSYVASGAAHERYVRYRTHVAKGDTPSQVRPYIAIDYACAF